MTLISAAPLIVLLTVASATDLLRGLIPNRLIVLGFCAALFQQAYVQLHGSGSFPTAIAMALASYALGALVCGLAPLILYCSGSMGGGDVKLLAMSGAFLGPSAGIEVEVYAFLLMALYAAAKLAYRGRLLSMVRNCVSLLRNPLLPKAQRRVVAPELMTVLRFAPSLLASTLLITSLRLVAR